MKEITKAKKGDNKARLCWCESKRTSEKNHNLFHGEVFFLLTGHLIGDSILIISLRLTPTPETNPY